VCAYARLLDGCTQSAARSAFCVNVGLASNCTYAAAKDAYCAQNSAFADYPCLNVPVVVIAGTTEEPSSTRINARVDRIYQEAYQRTRQELERQIWDSYPGMTMTEIFGNHLQRIRSFQRSAPEQSLQTTLSSPLSPQTSTEDFARLLGHYRQWRSG
jgi:hypothetical protein